MEFFLKAAWVGNTSTPQRLFSATVKLSFLGIGAGVDGAVCFLQYHPLSYDDEQSLCDRVDRIRHNSYSPVYLSLCLSLTPFNCSLFLSTPKTKE